MKHIAVGLGILIGDVLVTGIIIQSTKWPVWAAVVIYFVIAIIVFVVYYLLVKDSE